MSEWGYWGEELVGPLEACIDAGRASAQKIIESQTVMAATNQGNLEKVKQLIGESADVNTVYPHVNSFLDGHTPLIVAARDNHTEIVSELLKAGAKKGAGGRLGF